MIEMHRHIANACCEMVWALLTKPARTREETIDMLHGAHAACYHIEQVGAAKHIARCEWLVSRAYVSAGMGAPSLLHAERALELLSRGEADAATRALCLEACARAHYALGEPVDGDYCKKEAHLTLAAMQDDEEKEYVEREVQSLP